MRRIIEAEILFLSLCPKGANGFTTIYKSEDGRDRADFHALTQELEKFDERGQLVACVYAPARVDSQGDWCDRDVIEKMAHGFLRNGAKIDLVHDGKALPREDAFVAESFLIQKGDPRFASMRDYEGNPVDVSGGWGVVVQINDAQLRKAYRDGKWAGVSMGGTAKVVREDLIKMDEERVVALLRKYFPDNPALNTENPDMTKQEIEQLVSAAVAEAVAKIAQPAPKTEEKQVEKTEQKPAEIDLGNPEAVLAKAKTEALRKAAADADMTTAEGRKTYRDAVAAIEAEFAPAQKAEEKPVEKAKPAPSKVAKSGTDEQVEEPTDEAKLIKSGLDLAKYIDSLSGR